MDRLCVVADKESSLRRLRPTLSAVFDARYFPLSRLPGAAPEEFTLVDIDLRSPGPCHELRSWLKRRPRGAQVIFCVRRDSHADMVQAQALGATGMLARPITGAGLRAKLDGKNGLVDELSNGFAPDDPGVDAGATALHDIFDAALQGKPIDAASLGMAGEAIVTSIEEAGLGRWIDAVRQHHSQTYQHCLLVTGVAVGFARHLGFHAHDRQRIGVAGLLHDVGKAKIPVAILEKPGPLDPDELKVMREHPELGLQALQSSPGLQPEMLDMVVHHHEYLDGSGYPHGLMADSISDLVRTITIADIYGALIERRCYKAPLDPHQAYKVLLDMRGKLDRDLVREFEAIANA